MAARPIWNGTLSFGLLNIPIQLMTGERNATSCTSACSMRATRRR